MKDRTYARPCLKRHARMDPLGCNLCRLAAREPAYAALWALDPREVARAQYLLRKAAKGVVSLSEVVRVRRH